MSESVLKLTGLGIKLHNAVKILLLAAGRYDMISLSLLVSVDLSLS